MEYVKFLLCIFLIWIVWRMGSIRWKLTDIKVDNSGNHLIVHAYYKCAYTKVERLDVLRTNKWNNMTTV